MRTESLNRVRIALLATVTSALIAPAAGRTLMQQNGTYVPSAVNRTPEVSDQNEMRQQQSNELRIEAANAQRKKEITEDSEKLLKMAADLKEELDKTNKDTLSVDAIHKIDAIQKLARSMKDKLRLRTN